MQKHVLRFRRPDFACSRSLTREMISCFSTNPSHPVSKRHYMLATTTAKYYLPINCIDSSHESASCVFFIVVYSFHALIYCHLFA